MEFRYDEGENGWVSEEMVLTGETFLALSLPDRGRVCLRKSNSADGPWPIILMSPHTGPDFRIHLFGQAKGKHIKVLCTDAPVKCSVYNL